MKENDEKKATKSYEKYIKMVHSLKEIDETSGVWGQVDAFQTAAPLESAVSQEGHRLRQLDASPHTRLQHEPLTYCCIRVILSQFKSS